MHLISLQTLVLRNVNNLSFSGCPIARTKNLNAVRIEQVIPLMRRLSGILPLHEAVQSSRGGFSPYSRAGHPSALADIFLWVPVCIKIGTGI